MTPIDKAISAIGSQKKLADALGVSPQFINQIKRRGGELTTDKVTPEQWVKVTAERCAKIEELTNGKVKKSELRPDLWD